LRSGSQGVKLGGAHGRLILLQQQQQQQQTRLRCLVKWGEKNDRGYKKS
jgi:hypothetical protein